MLPNKLNKQEDWIERWHDGRKESYMQVPPLEVFQIRMKMIENRRKTKVWVITLSIAAALVCCLLIGAIMKLNESEQFKKMPGMVNKEFRLPDSISKVVMGVNVQKKRSVSAKQNDVPVNIKPRFTEPIVQEKDSLSGTQFTPLLTANTFFPDSIKESATLQNVPAKTTLIKKGELLYYLHLKNNQKNQDSLRQPVRAYDPPADLLQTSNKINTGDVPIRKLNH